MPDNSMKRNVFALLDNDVSDIDEISLAIAINNFLAVPVSFEETLVIYASLLDMCNAGENTICDPLRAMLLSELKEVSPVVVAEKMRKYSISIRKIFADAIASTLCREYQSILDDIRDTICSNSTDDLLAVANAALPVAVDTRGEPALLHYPCRV